MNGGQPVQQNEILAGPDAHFVWRCKHCEAYRTGLVLPQPEAPPTPEGQPVIERAAPTRVCEVCTNPLDGKGQSVMVAILNVLDKMVLS